MRQFGRALLVVPIALTIAATPGGKAERPISETDLYRFNWIADPQISPDGSRILYVRVTVNEKRDGYQTSLWIAPSAGREAPRQFSSGPRDAAPAWSPDGRTVAFTRVLEKEGKPQPAQIYLMDMAGGEARQLTELKKGAGAPVWSPDGKTIAFSTSTPAEIVAEERERDEPERPVGDTLPSRADTTPRGTSADAEGEKSDVRVITRAVYRLNGPGYLDPTSHDHIWTVALSAPGQKAVAKQLTAGEFDENRPTWSPDGSRIYFTSTRTPEPYYQSPDADLYSIPAAGGEITQVASIDGVIGDFAFSPDGRSIAFVGNLESNPPKSYDQSDLFVVENAPGKAARNLTGGFDFDIDGGIASDQHAPRGRLPSAPVWSADGSTIFVRAAEHGRANIKRVALSSGRVTAYTEGDQEVVAYTATRGGARFALVVSTPTVIGDLFVTSSASGGRVTLAPVVKPNEALWTELSMSAPEEIWYPSFDGQRIHGWIQKPPGFDASKKYPLILQIHGGPHAAYGYTFYHEIQWMAAKGYVVLYTNPRGSSSYGQDFGNIIQYRYPGDDYKDLMVGVDTLLARGYLDPKRLGITGGSGGGILTNWAITQTDRFAAAVAQRSIADWGAFWFTADFSQFTPFWFRKAPWQDPREFAERSPITYVDKIVTPLMLVEGEADWRTPPGAGGELMFRALKFLKKPVVMVRFPDESHDLSRSGKPKHRIERLQHIVNWFDKYLMGRQVEGYAVQ